MAKRLHDTEIWRNSWFRKLPKESKLLWFYLKDECNCAGIIAVDDLEQTSFLLGCKITKIHLDKLEKQFKKIDDRRIILIDFINFQYGNISESHKMYNKVMSELAKFDLKYPIDTLSIPYRYSIDTVKDKDKDKDISLEDKNNTEVAAGISGPGNPPTPVQGSAPAAISLTGDPHQIPPRIEWVIAYCRERRNKIDPQQFFDHNETRGWVPKGATKIMKNWQAAVRTWEKYQPQSQQPVNRQQEAALSRSEESADHQRSVARMAEVRRLSEPVRITDEIRASVPDFARGALRIGEDTSY